ncbi:type III toxin-antitoxin system ToxN/AbiQ family toxin [Mycoplasma sp. Ms02]|uniref:type III toxin-antitoxin system ToxN/AbiQ family toxin n=1 Tax=Mycoplasma sp. Ms02 TaxID=353851 RepID=UPI001C8ABCA6|nr:type III toxin-antitoxin system ToxN/AbiQ family toxin [Mycoplasma sp. Ms02]
MGGIHENSKVLNLKFYEIDVDYLKYLNNIDPEVFYSQDYKKNRKPFLGILVFINNNHSFFIPLTSFKDKHKTWPKISKSFAFILNEKDEKIALLETRKMIPVKKGLFKVINIRKFDVKYRNLLNKQLNFSKLTKNWLKKFVVSFIISKFHQVKSWSIIQTSWNSNKQW